MDAIHAENSVVHFGQKAYQELNAHLERINYSKVFIIVDTNTHENCLPRFLSQTNISSDDLEIIEFPAGEDQKTIETCYQIWMALSEIGADRKSLIINLGGGVVTDLGGFVACTFKRGIAYINVPTSLLAMVDASVGGKTGVDLGSLKNQVGVIANGEMVIIDHHFLETLPAEQMRSGLSEMLKHGLIADRLYWNNLKQINQLLADDLLKLIYESVLIKNNIVKTDPKEDGLRKSLNFGHTLGHAIESYHLESEHKKSLLHGEAIAIGMILEAYISKELLNLPQADLDDIKEHFMSVFPTETFNREDILEIINLLKHDKKNSHGIVKFALIESIGTPKLDCEVDELLIHKAFEYYQT
jgi:3-dehydroquinate synthase